MCQDIVNDLLLKGIATKSEDSIVVHFDNMPTTVIQKSNGNFLYALYDIAAIKWRVENHNPNKIVYVVDNRQSLHFKQVFDITRKAGYVKDTKLEHVAFGTILGPDKKPLKTKSGDALYLNELFDDGVNSLKSSEYYQNLKSNILDEILHKTIVGGLKFHDLKFNKTQDYVFDWKNILNFSGGSAPYIQNAMVRIDSICYKLNIDVEDNHAYLNFKNNWDELEENLIFQTQKLDELIWLKSYSSQFITEQLINICQLVHHYYEFEKIIGHVDQQKKVNLLKYVWKSLSTGISILGIEHYPCNAKVSKLISVS